jgi:plastocyanin
MGRGRSLLASALAFAALVAGCGGSDDEPRAAESARASVTVDIASFRYLPRTVTVETGGQVTWVNQDRAPHTATADEGQPAAFDTGRLKLSERDTVTLNEPGTYSYYCVFHRFMTAKLEVVSPG